MEVRILCIFREEARAKANEQSTIRSSMPKEIRAMLRSKDWMISPKSSSTSEMYTQPMGLS